MPLKPASKNYTNTIPKTNKTPLSCSIQADQEGQERISSQPSV